MGHHDPAELVVGLGVADDAEERREPGSGPEQIERAAGTEVVDHQGAGRLTADDDFVPGPEVLQTRGQGSVRNLDREELERVVVMGAGQRIGAQERLAVARQAHHHELAAAETERWRARGAETEQAIGPVMDAQDLLVVERAHETQGLQREGGPLITVWRLLQRSNTNLTSVSKGHTKPFCLRAADRVRSAYAIGGAASRRPSERAAPPSLAQSIIAALRMLTMVACARLSPGLRMWWGRSQR